MVPLDVVGPLDGLGGSILVWVVASIIVLAAAALAAYLIRRK